MFHVYAAGPSGSRFVGTHPGHDRTVAQSQVEADRVSLRIRPDEAVVLRSGSSSWIVAEPPILAFR